jgi:hypothetical protein
MESNPLRLNAIGLSDIDFSSLKSMLSLSSSLLTHTWILSDAQDAELTIFSQENPDSLNRLTAFSGKYTALLTKESTDADTVDIVLRKPLRTKNFSEALNTIEAKIKRSDSPIREQIQITREIEEPSEVRTEPTIEAVKEKTSFFGRLTQKFSNKKQPASDLPVLNLTTVDSKETAPNTLLEPTLLQQWLEALPENDVDKVTTAILGHIVPLNRSKLSSDLRLKLLDIYKTPISKLVFNRDVKAINRELNSPAEFQRSIKALNQLLEELVLGYKMIVNEKYQQGERPNTNDAYLVSIIRVGELLSLLIVQCYRYYRSAPVNAFYELHQLFIYTEASKTALKTVSTKSLSASIPFQHYYCQIILTGISDPYSLPKYEVFRLFKLMDSMADKVIVKPLTETQRKSPSGFLGRGNFCLDCESDQLPIAINKTPDDVRLSESTRSFSTEAVLAEVDAMFKKYASTNRGGYDLDFNLLKKIIPQLNSTYERKFQRLPVAEPRIIKLTYGVSDAHALMTQERTVDFVEWQLMNEGTHGIMVSHSNDRHRRLNIDEVVIIFEEEQPVKLATIRWLHIDNNEVSLLGLETPSGEPTPITFTADGETTIYQGLMFPGDKAKKRPLSLFVDKGIYSKNRVLRVKQDGELFVIKTEDLIVNGFNYEQFSFKVVPNKPELKRK